MFFNYLVISCFYFIFSLFLFTSLFLVFVWFFIISSLPLFTSLSGAYMTPKERHLFLRRQSI
ncbi:MAG: hypothetical protein BSOLF_0989 [Candidatus Carbobacillus altaicus]|uniref:Uncharacterized protein n=1 Tax=Candidatus Carbonibacillus altaicus TaxID=2163959 RepID=A0A2R6XX76_9BACL|nr:MAG: hypothetical protein BSOLF_0989 [Candidatus Carbobacillus altaicus]